ncbi:MAG: hypothetical protein Q7T74_04055 [Candidatus Saccharibacteria bacterium]|nr:hypothetical protein [Candidatus Saccharibacteria bacterium]
MNILKEMLSPDFGAPLDHKDPIGHLAEICDTSKDSMKDFIEKEGMPDYVVGGTAVGITLPDTPGRIAIIQALDSEIIRLQQ